MSTMVERRIIQTLREAGVPLTYRHLATRCGMGAHALTAGSILRATIQRLIKQKIVHRCEPGLFVIWERQ